MASETRLHRSNTRLTLVTAVHEVQTGLETYPVTTVSYVTHDTCLMSHTYLCDMCVMSLTCVTYVCPVLQLMDEDGSENVMSMDSSADLEQEGTLVFQSDFSGDIGLGDNPMVLPDQSADDAVEMEVMTPTNVGDVPTEHVESLA